MNKPGHSPSSEVGISWPATPAGRWALGMLVAQVVGALLFLGVAQATHRGALLASAYYAVIGFGIAALIAGIVVSMKRGRAAWLFVSLAAIAVYVGVAVYAFACCARWGS